jgi:hypothetical protein
LLFGRGACRASFGPSWALRMVCSIRSEAVGALFSGSAVFKIVASLAAELAERPSIAVARSMVVPADIALVWRAGFDNESGWGKLGDNWQ